MKLLTRALFALTLSSTLPAFAQDVVDIGGDPRGPVNLTICSQNLENYGSFASTKVRVPQMTQEDYRAKERALALRFASQDCDIIAVQEVLGRDDELARQALAELATAVRRVTNRFYEVKVGPTLDRFSHVGYLVAVDRGTIMNTLSYEKVEVPKISPKDKPRQFIRVPLEIQVNVKPLGAEPGKTISLINIHFKSRRGASGDPAELEWETYRMAMAEGIRRIVELRHSRAFQSGETLLAVLGDRNSHFDCASARILEGSLVLRQFLEDGVCRLSKRGVPLCQAGSQQPQKLFSVLTTDPQSKLLPGTLQYQGEFSWLDDILMPSESLRFAWAGYDTPGDFDSGVVNSHRAASDHGMVWVKLNW